jgi:hypothetical protein
VTHGLETLARLRFEPRGTDELGMLVATHALARPWLAASLRPLLERGWAGLTDQPLGQDSESVNPANPLFLSPEPKAGLSSLSSVDDDADGLTNTQEEWWCTGSWSDAQIFLTGERKGDRMEGEWVGVSVC